MMTLLVLLPKQPTFSSKELLRFANIFDNAGQVFLGVMVLSPFVSRGGEVNWLVVFSGTVLTLTSWFLSILLTRKGVEIPR